ncbi:MAG: hypothetical protein AAF491_03375, partial [Verrucomicrobiota bacterium]
LKAGLGFGILSGIGLVALGPHLLPLWVGENFHEVAEGFRVDRVVLAAFSAYFLLHLWRHMNQVLVLGMGRINQVVAVVVAEALVLVSFATLALNRTGDLSIVYLVLSGAILLFTGWMLPLLFVNGLRASEEQPMPVESTEMDEAPKAFT